MHLDTKRNYRDTGGKQTKISWLNKIILLCAVIDRNMTHATMVHGLLWIIWLVLPGMATEEILQQLTDKA